MREIASHAFCRRMSWGGDAPRAALREAWSANLSTRVLTATRHAYSAHVRGEPDTLRLQQRWFDMIGPVGPPCTNLERYGRRDQLKMACALSQARAPCVIISIGSNNEWQFEEDAFRRTTCRIETFDSTLRPGSKPPAEIATRTRLHFACIGTRNHTDSRGRQFLDWPSLVARATIAPGVEAAPVAYLKMDAEGAELEVLPQMLETPSLLPPQLGMELHKKHYFATSKELTGKCSIHVAHDGHASGSRCYTATSEPFFDRMATLGGLAMLFELLWQRGGYALVARRDNMVSSCCTEVLLVRQAGVAQKGVS